MLVQTYPQLTSSSSSPSIQPPHPPTNGINCSTRIVRLRRVGNSPLGFSIRGGWEHGTGIFISEVHPGSEAQLEGLKPGDQILRVNGFIIEQAIHEEVIALIKSSSRITLKVKSVGMIPIKSNRSETLSWKLVDTLTSSSSPTNHSNGKSLTSTVNNNNSKNNNSGNNSSNSSAVSSLSVDSNSNSSDHSATNLVHHPNHHQLLHRSHHHHNHSHHRGPPPPPPCPVHSVGNWSTGSSSKSPSSARSSLSSSRSSEDHSGPDKDLFTSYGLTHGDYMEARVFIRIAPGQGLGCSVVKGPSNYPGIFVQTIKEGGIAQESGLEVGDQIIAMNGLSMEPGDIEFNEAIARIKSASQMTLTVRKKSGLSLFQQQQHQSNGTPTTPTNGLHHSHHNNHYHYPKHRVKAIVHSPPTTTSTTTPTKTNGTTGSGISKATAAAAVAAAVEEIYHSPLSNNHHHHHHHHHSSESSSASSFNGPSRFYAPSEHDYSLSEVESNGNDVMMKLPLERESTPSPTTTTTTCNGKVGSPMDKVLLLDGGRRVITTVNDPNLTNGQGRHDVSAAAALIYDKVRREEERLAEEKKKLESEQKRLQCELEKLEKERKQLENLKPQDDSKSISSTSTISGSGNPSISSSNGSNSQMGFLDEIKKLAEKRSSENGLITDTLNKTRNLEKMLTKGPKTSCISGQDDENRKRHELLMEEFRAAHSKMFGSGERKLREVIKSNGLINGNNKDEKLSSNQQINGKTNQQTQESKLKHLKCEPNVINGNVTNGQSNHSNDNNHHSNNCVTNNNNIINGHHLQNNNKNKLIKGPVTSTKSIPPPIQQSITNSNGETVTILRTTSPCKKLIPPPVPVKKASSSPIVTISSYESHNSCKNRFLINNSNHTDQSNGIDGHENESSNHFNTKSNLVTVDGKTIVGVGDGRNEIITNGLTINNEINKESSATILTTSSSTGTRPVSIKINLQ